MFVDVISYISEQCTPERKVLLNSIVWLTQVSFLKIIIFLPERPTHFNEREEDGKENILWEWSHF